MYILNSYYIYIEAIFFTVRGSYLVLFPSFSRRRLDPYDRVSWMSRRQHPGGTYILRVPLSYSLFPAGPTPRAPSELHLAPPFGLHLVPCGQSLVLLALDGGHDLARVLRGAELEVVDALPRAGGLRGDGS